MVACIDTPGSKFKDFTGYVKLIVKKKKTKGKFYFKYFNGEEKCKNCQFYIADGNNCNNIGAAYFNSEEMTEDPWPYSYKVKKPDYKKRSTFDNGYTLEENTGKLAVFYNSDGKKLMGCGKLNDSDKKDCGF